MRIWNGKLTDQYNGKLAEQYNENNVKHWKTNRATQRLRAEAKNPAHPVIALASVLAPAAQVPLIF